VANWIRHRLLRYDQRVNNLANGPVALAIYQCSSHLCFLRTGIAGQISTASSQVYFLWLRNPGIGNQQLGSSAVHNYIFTPHLLCCGKKI
jgi:hypothetical protein